MDVAPSNSDVVSVDNIVLNAVVGLDQWARTDISQPLSLSLAFRLPPDALLLSAAADEPRFSLSPYDAIRVCTETIKSANFASPKHLLAMLASALLPVASACEEIRLRLDMRRTLGCLRAEDGVRAEAIVHNCRSVPEDMRETNLKMVYAWTAASIPLSVTLGQSDHERSMRQNIMLDVRFDEGLDTDSGMADQDAPYPLLLERIIQVVEESSFRSVERLVQEAATAGVLGSPLVDRVTVRVRKVKAHVTADASSVQMTKSRASFMNGGME